MPERKPDGFVPLAERARPSILAAELMLLTALAGLWLSSLAVGALAPGDGAELWMDLLYYGPFVLAPIVVYCARRGNLSDGLRLNPLPMVPTVMIAFMALLSVFASSAINGLWGMLLNGLGLSEPQAALEVGGSRDLMLAVIHTAAIPAVCEELLFRGVVFSAFERRGTAVGIGVSSALFGLLHGNVYGLPAYILVGAVSGLIVFMVDSVYAGMLYHTVYNAAILVLLHWAEQLPELSEASASTNMTMAMVMDFALMAVAISMMLTALNLRRRAVGIEAVPATPARMSGWEKALMVVLLLALAASMVVVQALAAGVSP